MFNANISRVCGEGLFHENKKQVFTATTLVLVALFACPVVTLAVDYQAQDLGGDMQVQQEAVDFAGDQAGQAMEQSQELWDILGVQEEDMIFFDPDSIPDSPP